MADPKKPVDRDEVTGVETTGHEWDGIRELNLPAPRWWLIVFFITIVWSVGYWVVYPAWPTLSGNTKGTLGWTQYTKLADEQAEIMQVRGEFAEKIRDASLAAIQGDPQLYQFALAGGKTMFKENCAACHGTGAQGGSGYPNLNDDDWLWGGTLEDIYATIQYGARSAHDKTRFSQMPAFRETLKPAEISKLADYVLSLSGKGEASAESAELFKQNCAACHSADGKGDRKIGAPNLADAIWLYGGDKQHIVQQINVPRHGVMPAWNERLSDETIKQLTIYVHSLGGGEAPVPKK